MLESVPESLPLKLGLLKDIERAAPDGAVIATNTSSLPLDRLAGVLHAAPSGSSAGTGSTRHTSSRWWRSSRRPRPTRTSWLVGGEAPGAGQTAPRAVEAIEGFLANRLQYALIREALALVQDGAATPEQIDAVITDCLGPRWAVIGPMRSSDLAGIGTAAAVAAELFPKLSDAERPPPALTDLLEQGRLGRGRAGRGSTTTRSGRAWRWNATGCCRRCWAP